MKTEASKLASPVPDWTPARFRSFIISTLRSGMRRYPNKALALKAASVGKKINKLTGRMAEHFQCRKCSGHFPRTSVQVDHIDPVVDPNKGFIDWNSFIERMFVALDKLQVLCKTCHSGKTRTEQKERVAIKRKKFPNMKRPQQKTPHKRVKR